MNYKINISYVDKKYDAIVLGRGPLGIYTSCKLTDKGYRVLNIDCGTGLKKLKEKQYVKSNILWKTKQEAPSLDEQASHSRWHGGCMNLPTSELGNRNLTVPIAKENFLNSTENVKKFFNITDFDFSENKPYEYSRNKKHTIDNVRYTYLTKNLNFEEKIQKLESSDLYNFVNLKELTTFKLTPGEEIIIESVDISKKVTLNKASRLFICLGAVENARLLMNNSDSLNLSLKNIGKNLNDHLRFPVAKIKFKNFSKFRNIFDKKRNSTNSRNLWPRYIVESDDLKSYGFFKDWRYSNIFLRKLNLNFFKKIFSHKGTAVLYLFTEKLLSNNTNLNLSITENLIPNLEVNFNLVEDEIKQLNSLTDSYLNQLSEQFGNQIMSIDKYNIDTDEKFLKSVVSSNHPSGTTPMGTGASSSVVNSDSQLWDHSNIFVFGSSTLPRPYYIHPTFTSMVIADVSLNSFSNFSNEN